MANFAPKPKCSAGSVSSPRPLSLLFRFMPPAPASTTYDAEPREGVEARAHSQIQTRPELLMALGGRLLRDHFQILQVVLRREDRHAAVDTELERHGRWPVQTPEVSVTTARGRPG